MRIGTHDDNMQDMTGRARHGLSHSVVRAIRKLLEQGRTQEEIATLYGVSREAISAIATRRAYGHLD
jgi:transcriptional regulator